MRKGTSLAMTFVKIIILSLGLFCALLTQGTPVLSGEPVQLPSLGIIPPEPPKSSPEVKAPVKAHSLGVIDAKTAIPEQQPMKPVQLPSLGVILPESPKNGPEVKPPVEAHSLGVIEPKPTAPEKQPKRPVKLPSLEKK